ncbi:MAG: hypothetical protein AAF934_03125 [Bacteroidota bacterium]
MALSLNITIEQLAEAFKGLSNEERVRLKALLPTHWFEEDAHGFVLSSTHKKLLDEAERCHREDLSESYSWEEVKAYAIKQRTT